MSLQTLLYHHQRSDIHNGQSNTGKYITSYGKDKMYEYVGGDAYNYIIEAALRGGEISGAKTAKAIYFAASGIMFVLSVSLCGTEYEKKQPNHYLNNPHVAQAVEEQVSEQEKSAEAPEGEMKENSDTQETEEERQ